MAMLESKSFHTRPGTWTQNLKIRSLARYPITPTGPVEPLKYSFDMILQDKGDRFRIHMDKGIQDLLIWRKSPKPCLCALSKPPQRSRMKIQDTFFTDRGERHTPPDLYLYLNCVSRYQSYEQTSSPKSRPCESDWSRVYIPIEPAPILHHEKRK